MKISKDKKTVGQVQIGDTVTVYLIGGAIIRGTLTADAEDGMTLDNAEKYENERLSSIGSVSVPRSDIGGYGYSRGREAIVERYQWELTTHIPQGLKGIRIHRSRRL